MLSSPISLWQLFLKQWKYETAETVWVAGAPSRNNGIIWMKWEDHNCLVLSLNKHRHLVTPQRLCRQSLMILMEALVMRIETKRQRMENKPIIPLNNKCLEIKQSLTVKWPYGPALIPICHQCVQSNFSSSSTELKFFSTENLKNTKINILILYKYS